MHKRDPRRVMIVEGNPDGHRLYYVSILLRAAIDSGGHVTVVTSGEALASPEWSAHLGALSEGATVALLEDFGLESVRALADELQVEHVVIPDGDSFVYDLARGKRWSNRSTVTALAMREKAQPSAVPATRALRTLAKKIAFVLANTRPNVEVRILKSGTWRGFSVLPIARDPVILASQASDQIQLPSGKRFWFGIVGSVGHRKNLPLVSAALACLDGSEVGLVVAGQIEAGVLELAKPHLDRIRRQGGEVMIIDRLLSDSEMDGLIEGLDCVVLAHSNDGPSGILGKAVAAGTRIVAAGAPTLRTDCRHIGTGAEWVGMTEPLLAGALGRAISQSPPLARKLASPAEFSAALLENRS